MSGNAAVTAATISPGVFANQLFANWNNVTGQTGTVTYNLLYGTSTTGPWFTTHESPYTTGFSSVNVERSASPGSNCWEICSAQVNVNYYIQIETLINGAVAATSPAFGPTSSFGASDIVTGASAISDTDGVLLVQWDDIFPDEGYTYTLGISTTSAPPYSTIGGSYTTGNGVGSPSFVTVTGITPGAYYYNVYTTGGINTSAVPGGSFASGNSYFGPVTVTSTTVTITNIVLGNSTLLTNAPANSAIGTLTAILSSGLFTGTFSISGANAANFQITGNTLYEIGSLAQASYNITITANQPGLTSFSKAEVIVVSQAVTLQSITLSNNTAVSGPSAVTVGSITVVTSPAGGFTGTLSLSGSNSSLFILSGSSLEIVANCPAGAFPVTITATMPGNPGSPLSITPTITVTQTVTLETIGLGAAAQVSSGPVGTVIGPIQVSVSSGSFTGTLSLSGTNASDFEIVSSNLEFAVANLPPAVVTFSITATQAGAVGSPLTQPFQLQIIPPATTIDSVSLSTTSVSFQSSPPVGTVLASITVITTPANSFTGTYTLFAANGLSPAPAYYGISGSSIVTTGTLPVPTTDTFLVQASIGGSSANSPIITVTTSTTSVVTITGISITGKTVVTGAITAIGVISVSTTGGAFTGTLSLSGTSASLFQISGTTLEPATTSVPVNSYSINIVATQTGATGSPFTQAETITVTAAPTTITGITLSNKTVLAGAALGTVVGTISVTTTGSPFSGTLSITTTSLFALSGNNLVTAATIPTGGGPYQITITATQSGATGSPFTQSETITVTTTAVSLSSISFSNPNPTYTGSPTSGTTITTVTVVTSPAGGFTGTLSLAAISGGTLPPYFQFSGSNINTNSVLAVGSYSFNVVATQTGATGSPLSQELTVIVNAVQTSPTINSINLSSLSFTANAPAGTVVGSITVNVSNGSFTGTLSLSGTNAASFGLNGTNLVTAASLAAGSYNINIVATQSGAIGSPFTQAETLTASATQTLADPITYSLSFSTASSGPWTPFASGLTSTTEVVTGLTGGTHYFIQVTASDSILGLTGTPVVAGPFATTTLQESANGTVLTLTTGVIIDSLGNTWALADSPAPGGVTAASGVGAPTSVTLTWTAPTGSQGLVVKMPNGTLFSTAVIELLYFNHLVYMENATGFFDYVQSSGTWVATTDPRTMSGPSANGTVVTNTTSYIIDSALGSWQLTSGGQVIHNSIVDTSTSSVTLLLYWNQLVYKETSAGAWADWNSAWIPVTTGDPRIVQQPGSVSGSQNSGTTNPIISAPTSGTVEVSEVLSVTGITFADTLWPNAGDCALNVGCNTGTIAMTVSGALVAGSNTAAISYSGTTAQSQAAIASLTYTPKQTGTDIISVNFWDQYGNNNTVTILITVSPVSNPSSLPGDSSGIVAYRIADMLEIFGVNCFPDGQDGSGTAQGGPGTNAASDYVTGLNFICGGSGMGMFNRIYANSTTLDEPFITTVCQGVPNSRFTTCINYDSASVAVVQSEATDMAASGYLVAVEGYNEPDNASVQSTDTAVLVAACLTAQEAIYTTVNPSGKPSLGLKVMLPSITDDGSNTYEADYMGSSLATFTANANWCNGHDYPNSGSPNNDMNRRSDFLVTATGLPVAITEWHPLLYNTAAAQATGPAGAAYYTAVALLSGYVDHHLNALIWFCMYDYEPDFGIPVGLFQGFNPATPSLTANTMQAMFQLATDLGGTTRHTFVPSMLNYTVSGLPTTNGYAGGRQALFQNSSGTFFLFLWNEQNTPGGTATPVIVTFLTKLLQVVDFNITGPTPMTPVQTVKGSTTITVQLTASVHMLVITYGGTEPVATVSASGTTLTTTVGNLVDASLNVWTLVTVSGEGLEAYVNGKSSASTNNINVTLLLYYNTVIYQENSSNAWFSWNTNQWVAIARDPRLTISANGASLNSTTGTLIDSVYNVWNLVPLAGEGFAIDCNGVAAGTGTNNVILLLYYNTSIYQENNADDWWTWANGGWVSIVGDPRVVPSANGATINSATGSLIDLVFDNWTLVAVSGEGFEIYLNGTVSAGTNNVILMLYYNLIVYQENINDDWWGWIGGVWTPVQGDPRVVTSAQGATLTTSSGTLTDPFGYVWSLTAVSGSGLEVYENGAPAGTTANVVLLLYYNSGIYQENSSGNWWDWINNAWNPVPNDPRTPISANSAMLTSTTGSIIDSSLNNWTLQSVTEGGLGIYENGVYSAGTNSVILLLYFDGIIYQEISTGVWYSWSATGLAWSQIAADPRSGPGTT